MNVSTELISYYKMLQQCEKFEPMSHFIEQVESDRPGERSPEQDCRC